MQVMWMVLVTLGLALGGDPGARGDIPGNRLGQASVSFSPPSALHPCPNYASS